MTDTPEVQSTYSMPLHGRAQQLAALDGLLEQATRRRGGALAIAGLHQLLLPLGELAERVTERHRASLRPVLDPAAIAGDEPPETLALHAAVHALLVTAAQERPTLCCVDAAHDLDRASLSALIFTARRTDTVPLALVLAADLYGTDATDALEAVPWLRLDPVADSIAERILADHLGPMIPREVTSSVLDVASGNPLALTELAAQVTPEGVHCGHDRRQLAWSASV